MSPFVGRELREKLEKPPIFQWGTGGREQPPRVVHGYDVTLLVDFCKAVLERLGMADSGTKPNAPRSQRFSN
jgi:hypothetical protein